MSNNVQAFLETLFDPSWVEVIGVNVLDEVLSKVSTQIWSEENVIPARNSDLYFKAFRLTPFNQLKVTILGQDPYPDNSYNGLAFGNGFPEEEYTGKISPSLRNILSEVTFTQGNIPHPSLYNWATQGVLLINTAHSLVRNSPGSHISIWQPFTEIVINTIISNKPEVVWMLWGNHAQKYNVDKMKSICTGHPSPLNRANPFKGSGCFTECNNLLTSPIDWTK